MKGFKYLKNEDVITVRDFRRWNSDRRVYDVEKNPTKFALVDADEQIYAETLGTVVDEDGKELGALVWTNGKDNTAPKDKSE